MTARMYAKCCNTWLTCIVTVGLSNGDCQLMPILCNFQPCELLDLARLHRDAGDVDAQNLFHLNIDQLGSVESPCHSIQGAH